MEVPPPPPPPGLITQPKIPVAVRTLFESRTESFIDVNIISIGVLSSICEAPQKYDLFDHLKRGSTTVYSLCRQSGKSLRRRVSESQEGIWSDFCSSHPELKVAQGWLNNIHPYHFWSLVNQYPDLVKCLHSQVKLMCVTLRAANCFICWHTVDDSHFMPNFFRASKTTLPSYWHNGIN